jgi:PKD repeat protein
MTSSYYALVLVAWGDAAGGLSGSTVSNLYPLSPVGDILATDRDASGRQGVLVEIPEAHSAALMRATPDRSLSLQGVLPGGVGMRFGTTADLNGDGALDFLAVNADANTISLFPGNGDGTIGTRQDIGTGSRPVGAAAGDWDGDGRPDLLVASALDGGVALHRNLGTFRANHAPVARPGGPYSGVAGGSIAFDGTASEDPDGDPLRYQWRFGDGADGVGVQPVHAYSTGGTYRVVLAVDDGSLAHTDSTTAVVSSSLRVRLFRQGGSSPIVVGAGPPATCLYLEPISGAFRLEDVDPGSLSLYAVVAGSADSIMAEAGKHGSIADADHNGVADLAVCFGRSGLNQLFDGTAGRTNVLVEVRGRLLDGTRIEGAATLLVLGTGGGLASFVRPQPLSRTGVIGFRLTEPGLASVRLFDAQGRAVRTLLERTTLPSGYHEVTLRADGAGRSRLPSGVFFFRIETTQGTETGRILISR